MCKSLKKRGVIAGAVLLSCAACAKNPIEIPEVDISSVKVPSVSTDLTSSLNGEVVKGNYITIYSRIALRLRQCWLVDGSPLGKAQFFARNKADGSEKKADIFIHKPAVPPKRGPRIFSVHLKPHSNGTEVRLDNRHLTPQNEENVTRDIRNWIKGEKSCTDHAAEKQKENPEKNVIKKIEKITLPVRK
jgi:hypothetical protein